MESNEASSNRRKLSTEEVLKKVAQWKLEQDPLDAEIEQKIRNLRGHLSPTSAPRTFLFLGCLPMPLPSVVRQEVLLMVPTFFRRLLGWETWRAAPATQPAEPAGVRVEVSVRTRESRFAPRTATEVFDDFFGNSAKEKTVEPAAKPAGAAGPADPHAEGLGGGTGRGAVSDNVSVVVECKVYGLKE